MTLAAQQIVDAVVTRLTSNTPAGTRVYDARPWPVADAELPLWQVRAADEEIDAQTIHFPALLEHRLTVECVGLVHATSAVDTAMAAMAEQALGALYDTQAHTALGLSIQANHPTRIERRVQTEGQASYGEVTVSLLIKYRTAANAPGTIL